MQLIMSEIKGETLEYRFKTSKKGGGARSVGVTGVEMK